MSKKKSDDIVTTIKKENILDKPIETTMTENMMPYSLSVIESRAVPYVEDGLKPGSRFFLWGMKQAGADGNDTIKSATIVGRVMDYNPHGDAGIYGAGCTMVDSTLNFLTPYIAGQGSFGKHFCSEESPAASRYTEMKMTPLCKEIINESIKYHPSNMEDNYNGKHKQPKYLSAPFPAILANAQSGIAVGYACNFGSFNLKEICDATKYIIKNKKKADKDLLKEVCKLMPTMDFTTGAETYIDEEQIKEIYLNGHGQILLRAVFEDNKAKRILEIKEIPYSTNLEAIIKAVLNAVDSKKITEVSDIRNATGKKGFQIDVDYKSGTDIEELKKKLFALTSCQSSFNVNMNIICDGELQENVGVIPCIKKWIEHRTKWVEESLTGQLKEAKDKLHLLEGLSQILLDIDKAVKIVKNSKTDEEVISGLKKGFKLDDIQAEFVAEIKLRNFNKDYILNKTKEIKDLKATIKDLQDRLKDIDTELINGLEDIKKKYGIDRKTKIVDKWEELPVITTRTKEPEKLDGNCTLFCGNDAVKRVMSEAKAPNGMIKYENIPNNSEILIFTNTAGVFKWVIGKIPNNQSVKITSIKKINKKLGAGMQILNIFPLLDKYKILIIFSNGKAVKIPTEAWKTEGNKILFKKGISDKANIEFITMIDKDKIIDVNGNKLDTSKIKEVSNKTGQGNKFKFEK